MWIQVDPTHDGEVSWVNPSFIERCDVKSTPEPPYALLTMRSGALCTVSEVHAMQRLQKILMVEIPRA